MTHLEEQEAEMESLESIYSDTFQRISSNPYYFTIDLVPHPDSNEPNHVNLRLHIKYPLEYPEDIPKITTQSLKGLSPQTLKDLEAMALTICKENSGMCCIYNVCTQIQEWLVHHNIPFDTSLHEQMTAQQDLKKRLERLTFGEEGKTGDHSTLDTHSIQDFDLSYQRKKGTPVTVETFTQWSEKFIRQYREQKKLKELEETGPVDDKKDKMTGKQIFLEMSARNLKDNLDKLEQYDSSSGEEDEEEEKENVNKKNPAIVKNDEIVRSVHYEVNENDEEDVDVEAENNALDEYEQNDQQEKFSYGGAKENNEEYPVEKDNNNKSNNNKNSNKSNNKTNNTNKNNSNKNKNTNTNANTNTNTNKNSNKSNKKDKKANKTIVVKDENSTTRKTNDTVIVNDENLFLDLEIE